MTQPRDVLEASQLYQQWLAALKARALLATHNQSQAMFRAVLHALRRHMTDGQVLTFADALPPLPRGIFIEGWRPGAAQPLASPADLTRDVMAALAPHHVPPDSIVADVLAVLATHSDARAAATLRAQLPQAVQALWP
jgi:uncharacterized protein (DUF2267 family)